METVANVLNVSVIEPRFKHPTIFKKFDELEEGEDFVILNDHDPKPLYYQLLGERGNIFTWEYLEEGPENWQVRIAKRKLSASSETLGEIAAKDLKKAMVFKKYGLDFCCGGKKTVADACKEKGLDPELVEQELQQSETSDDTHAIPYNEWNLDFLADYVVNTHHAYARKTLPDLLTYADKVMRVHHDRHPELIKVNDLVKAISEEFYSHMEKEEQMLFPYIKKLAVAQRENQKLDRSPFGTVESPINMMEIEHETVGNYMKELDEITNGYTLPQDACASYSLLYRMLPKFEDDLQTHIHLENNILFPKAIKMEKEAFK